MLQERIRRCAQGNGGLEWLPVERLWTKMVGKEEDCQCGGNEHADNDDRFTMLHPKADLTAMGVGNLIVGVGMIFGKAGKKEKIKDKTR